MEPQLSGLELEYRIVLLYGRDSGTREAQLGAAVTEGTEDIGFRSRVAIVFTIARSHDVTLRVRDEHGFEFARSQYNRLLAESEVD
jgi:hypothetical protein